MLIDGARTGILLITIGFVLVLGSLATAGELTPELQAQMAAAKGPDEKIAVWIKLPRVDDPRQWQKDLNATYQTRGDRHQEAYRRLKEVHSRRQEAVLGQLRGIQARGEASRIRPRWLANIIEAEVTAGQIRALAARDDIELISNVPTLELVEPMMAGQSSAGAAGVQSNLTWIKAHLAWQAGYTGAGRVICSFDTGVDGDHPALVDNWKGNDGDYAAAWFDPLDGEWFPHTFVGGGSHGTHVMGILVGHDDITGDTTGVALDAKWISAGVIDIQGAPILDAFEWAADPDGDPNTVADVPDVINHSWGIMSAACIDVFYDLIDNLEALEIVNIFAAGNEGPTVSSMRNPADRALDSLDCFAVANIDHTVTPPLAANSSSRGPSPCNGGIKPNVSAPGTAIWSTVPNNGYDLLGGTSMAAPHVSGLVALLRQKNPNATVDQIKTAILTSSPDFGYTLPNNVYGWGFIDCMAALNALPGAAAMPNLRVWSFDHAPISPGDTVAGRVVLQNRGTAVNNVVGTITGSNPSLIVLDGTATFGTAPANDTIRSGDEVRVVVRDTVTIGSLLALDFQVTGTGYSVPAKLYFLVEPVSQRLQVNHDANNVSWTVTNYGSYGLDNASIFPHDGLGFRTAPSTLSETYESALLIGKGVAEVSDGARNAAGEPDGDFRIMPGGTIALIEPGEVATQETYSRFDDSRAENPIGIEVTQQTYQFTGAAYDDFVIVRYVLKNRSGASQSGIRVGLSMDWDVVAYQANAGGWESGDGLLWTAYNSAGTPQKYRGTKLLDGPVASAYTADASATTYYGPGRDGWTESEKYAALTSGFATADTYKASFKDLMQVLVAGPLTLGAGQMDTITFALVTGLTYAEFAANADASSQIYRDSIVACCQGIRGNANGDPGEVVNIADMVFLVNALFKGGPYPGCAEEGNVNGDVGGAFNIADLTYTVNYLYRGGPPPPSCP